jgi:hypothetical protein
MGNLLPVDVLVEIQQYCSLQTLSRIYRTHKIDVMLFPRLLDIVSLPKKCRHINILLDALKSSKFWIAVDMYHNRKWSKKEKDIIRRWVCRYVPILNINAYYFDISRSLQHFNTNEIKCLCFNKSSHIKITINDRKTFILSINDYEFIVSFWCINDILCQSLRKGEHIKIVNYIINIAATYFNSQDSYTHNHCIINTILKYAIRYGRINTIVLLVNMLKYIPQYLTAEFYIFNIGCNYLVEHNDVATLKQITPIINANVANKHLLHKMYKRLLVLALKNGKIAVCTYIHTIIMDQYTQSYIKINKLHGLVHTESLEWLYKHGCICQSDVIFQLLKIINIPAAKHMEMKAIIKKYS